MCSRRGLRADTGRFTCSTHCDSSCLETLTRLERRPLGDSHRSGIGTEHVGCRGFIGPVPPPLWMSASCTTVVQGCGDGNGFLQEDLCDMRRFLRRRSIAAIHPSKAPRIIEMTTITYRGARPPRNRNSILASLVFWNVKVAAMAMMTIATMRPMVRRFEVS